MLPAGREFFGSIADASTPTRKIRLSGTTAAYPDIKTPPRTLEGGGAVSIWLGTSTLLFANSGDTLAILLPLLMESSRPAALVVAVTFLVCALLWAILARVLSRQPVLVRGLP